MFRKSKLKMAIFIILAIINITNVSAEELSNYTIDNYNLDIIVNENNIFNITETITVTYNQPEAELDIRIPSSHKIKNTEGKYEYKRVKLSNININSPITSTGVSIIGLDSYIVHTVENKTQNDMITKTYQIKYNYDFGKDYFKNKDEIYFAIDQGRWDKEIKHFNIK